MAIVRKGNDSSASTRYELRMVKITSPPEGRGRSGAKRLRWLSLPRRNWHLPLTLTMRYQGGPCARIEVKTRGDAWSYDGTTALIDVLYDINSRGARDR